MGRVRRYGRGVTSAATRLVILLGHPVTHSLSPKIHNAAFAAAGVDAVYVACDVPPGRVADAVRGLAALGALGANVTVPHKRDALSAADVATPEARLVGAANTLWLEGGRRVHADNTDAVALRAVLREDAGVRAGDRAVIVGAGGAARAAAVALGRLGAAVSVHARRPGASADVVELALRAGAPQAAAYGGGAAAPPKIVINATPLGWRGEALPDPWLHLGEGQVALDLTYGRDTPFLEAARRRGAGAIDGLAMLVGQAALAFERWTGVKAPTDVMRETALAETST